MAKIRAYKIAEELGIERNEFVEKAREAGIELRNAMAPVDEEEAQLLREKLGAPESKAITEERMASHSGGAVIRRRKKAKEPEPEPEPEPEIVPESEVAAEPVAETPEGEEAPAEGAEPEPEPVEEPEPIAAADIPSEPVAAPAPAAQPRARAADRGEASDRAAQSRKQFKEVVNLREQEQIARQVTSRTTGRPVPVQQRSFTPPRRKRRDAAPAKAPAPAVAKAAKKVVRVEGEISVAELAKQLGAKAAQVQGKLMSLGTMVAMNQTIGADVATKIAAEFDAEVQNTGFQEAEFIEVAKVEGEAVDKGLEPRPAVVTVMGHVDHGKTSLLDALREANVVEGEAGGITQHIGAYQVDVGGRLITFIDTPGHAAFTAMRARGAQVTDIVVLVVAASEGIMPQTIEAIDQTRQRLMEHNVVVEDFGGDVLAIDISATKRTGLDKLLDALALQSEVLEPTADPNIRVKGVVLEAQLEKGRGPVATVLVQEGTLHRGDIIVAGHHSGRVRSMSNERGEVLQEALPSCPVQVVGLAGVPDAGESMHGVESERVAKDIVSHRLDQARGRVKSAPKPKMSLEDLFAQAEGGGPKELNIIIKADTQGSAEAVRDSMTKLTTDQVTLTVLHASVGGVTERDVQLAEASKAVIIGFHVRPDVKARRLAESSGVDIRSYQIIYEAIDEVKAAMAGLLPPTRSELILGQAQVRETFVIPKVGTIAGSFVTDGLVRRNAQCRLVRDGVQVFDGGFASLKRFKDDVREVQTGFECGIGVQGFNDVKVGDIIEAYVIEERPAEL
jgi:translation initiation factor IF-2